MTFLKSPDLQIAWKHLDADNAINDPAFSALRRADSRLFELEETIERLMDHHKVSINVCTNALKPGPRPER